MKSKLIIFLLLVLISLSISSVSAIDIDSNAIPEDNNNDVCLVNEENIFDSSLNDNSDDSILATDDKDMLSSESSTWYVNGSVSASGNGSQENPYKTFKEVVDNDDLKDGDTVMIAPGRYVGAGENVNLTIKTALNLVNWTVGDVIFDGERNSQIFYISANSFNITGITFQEGLSKYGAGIFFENAVSNSVFNGTFIWNRAMNTSDLFERYCQGGAMFFASKVENCIFDGDFHYNKASGCGGALCFNDTVVDSNFVGNFYDGGAFYGAAIYMCKDVSNTNFNTYSIYNVAYGGSFTFNGTVSDCDFNMDFFANNGGDFGSLYFLRNVDDCNFNCMGIGNAAEWGSVFYFKENITNSKFNGTFEENYVPSSGGVFYFENAVINCTIDGVFDKNIAGNCGGVLYIAGTLQDCIFNGTYSNGKSQFGTSFYLLDEAKNCIFDGYYRDNYALYGGVSIFNELENCSFTGVYINNTAEILGGTLYFKKNVVNSTVTGEYINNTVLGENGGAIFFKNNLTDSTINATFINNSAGNGGAIYFNNTAENSTISGLFINNSARNGSANYFNEVNGIVLSGKYINNTGNEVIYIIGANSYNVIQDSIFVNNDANIISVESGKVQAIDNWFGNNATNYNIKPEVVNVDMDDWLFLNATANPDVIILNKTTSIITFKLYSFNETSNDAIDYDGLKWVILLDLSSTGGSLNQTQALINEEILYAPSDIGDASVTGQFENVYDTVYLKNYKDIISAPDVTKYYKGPERFVVTVTDSEGNPLENKTVKINMNGVEYTKITDENGTVSMAIGLPSNTYDVTVTFDNQTVNSVVTVLPTVNGTDVVKMYRNGTQYYATFLDSEGKYLPDGTVVKFNINGVMYERKVSGEKGLAKLNINLPAKDYVITAMNPETGENAANNITVLSTITENKDITKYYKNGTQYTVQIIGDDGKAVGAGENVTFNVNGIFYTRQTNESGIAQLNINLPPGDYVVTAEYKGCKVSNDIRVLTVLTANDITMKYHDGTQFIATLLDGQGKLYSNQTVQFNINGVLYPKGTDSSGQAKLKINLPEGKYIITSSYNGLNIENKITVTRGDS